MTDDDLVRRQSNSEDSNECATGGTPGGIYRASSEHKIIFSRYFPKNAVVAASTITCSEGFRKLPEALGKLQNAHVFQSIRIRPVPLTAGYCPRLTVAKV